MILKFIDAHRELLISVVIALTALLFLQFENTKEGEKATIVTQTKTIIDSSSVSALRDSLEMMKNQTLKVQIHRVTVHDTVTGTTTTTLVLFKNWRYMTHRL
jgi:uncharacterized membrane protein YgcG